MAIPFAPSALDGNQVLQHAFDEATCKLRVDASVSLGATEVIIDHADDSIRLGDGTNLVSTTTVGSDVGLDVNIINNAVGKTPDVDNLSMPTSGTEYNYTFTTNTTKFKVRSRKSAKLQIAFSSGDTGTTYFTVAPGNIFSVDGILTTAGTKLYVQSTKNADDLEIVYWT